MWTLIKSKNNVKLQVVYIYKHINTATKLQVLQISFLEPLLYVLSLVSSALNTCFDLDKYHICPIVQPTNKINEWKKMFYMTVHVCVSWVLMAKTRLFSWKLASLFVFSAFGIIKTMAFDRMKEKIFLARFPWKL